MKKSFASLLRQWRQTKRYSQLQLATELDISSRHLSFLETGRSQPSREMILKIALFLLVPKTELNQALLAAGYAPIYFDQHSTSDLQPALDAIELMLAKHLPYPALVFNPDWDIVNANSAAQALLGKFNYQTTNFIEFLIEDHLRNKHIINWLETAKHILQRIHQKTMSHGISEKLAQLEKQLAACITKHFHHPTHSDNPIILSTQLQVDHHTLSFFSILAQLSSVQDLTVSEYMIELMFPADQNTTLWYKP
ncbi:helix-turn-helix domain-containing protein [Thiolinea disciformis]|uniref:helix-turn-helix domain-containing protein n=1 Tax=Thiolinea disciformis TaxID=125614 RepID=UPI000364416C|nr:helix-turn-helix domain-containing protein [Thiolinea disciformis]